MLLILLIAADLRTVVARGHAYTGAETAAFSLDGRFLFSSNSTGQEVKVWDAPAGRILHDIAKVQCYTLIAGPGPTEATCFQHRPAVIILNAEAPEQRRTVQLPFNNPQQLDFNGTYYAASNEGTIALLDARFQIIAKAELDKQNMFYVHFNVTGTHLGVMDKPWGRDPGFKRTLRVFEVPSMRETASYVLDEEVYSEFDVAPDGQSIVTTFKADAVVFSKAGRRVLAKSRALRFNDLAFTADGDVVAIDPQPAPQGIDAVQTVVRFKDGVEQARAVFGAGGGGKLARGPAGTMMRLHADIDHFETKNLDVLHSFHAKKSESSGAVFYSQAGDKLYVATGFSFRAWDLTTASPLWWRKTRGDALAVDPQREFAIYRSEDNALQQIDLRTGAQMRRYPFYREFPMYAAIAADRKRFIAGAGKRAIVFTVEGKQVCATLPMAEWVVDVRFSADGQRIYAFTSYDWLEEFDATTCKPISRKQQSENQMRELMPHHNLYAAHSGNRFYDDRLTATDGATLQMLPVDGFVFKQGSSGFAKPEHYTYSLAFDPRLPRFAQLERDGAVNIWGYGGRPVATLVAVDDAYAVVTPDGYYRTSKDGRRFIHYAQGNRTFSFDNFDVRFNRPDIVVERLGKANETTLRLMRTAHASRLKKLGFTEAMLSGELHTPDVSVSRAPREVRATSVAIDVQAQDTKFPLRSLVVAVNGVPRTQPWTGPRKIDVPLVHGDNRIEVSVLNDAGTESKREDVFVRRTGTAPTEKTFVAAIGVSKYRDAKRDLEFAAKDAQDVAKLFNGETLLLTDAAATRESLAQVKAFFARASVDDRVVLFVAGHGLLDDNLDYWFATHDIDFDKPAERGLAYGDLERVFDDSKALKRLVLMDTCHSGELDKDTVALAGALPPNVKARAFRGVQRKGAVGERASLELLRELFTDLRRTNGATVVASAGGAEYALESDRYKNGVFTYSLLSGLSEKSADANQDGAVRVSEMLAYVAAKVSELTQGAQRPAARADNVDFDFVVSGIIPR